MMNTKKNGVTNIAGYMPFSIQTGSMDPTIKQGDLIITKIIDSSELKKDDVISFLATEQNQTIIKTHRIVEIKNQGGMVSYITKGDNNEIEDSVEVAPGDILSIYTNTRIPFLGFIMDFLKSQWGFFFTIIVPLFIFFIYQLYQFIILIIREKQRQARLEIEREM